MKTTLCRGDFICFIMVSSAAFRDGPPEDVDGDGPTEHRGHLVGAEDGAPLLGSIVVVEGGGGIVEPAEGG